MYRPIYLLLKNEKSRRIAESCSVCVGFMDKILVSVPHTISDISIGNNIVSSAIWKKHARVLYEEQVLFEVFEKLTSACFFFKLREKSCRYLLLYIENLT